MPGRGERVDEVDVLITAFLPGSATRSETVAPMSSSTLPPGTPRRSACSSTTSSSGSSREIERLGRDALLADKATTLPAFEQIAERAIARAAADRRLALHRDNAPSASPDSAAGRMSWAAAHDMLRQAVGAFGGGGEQRALAHLQAQDPRLAAFVRDVGWRTLARSDAAMNDVKFAYLQYRPADDQESAA